MTQKNKISPYIFLGFFLTIIGAGLSIVTFFKFTNSQFTAIGIAIFILGTTTMLLPDDPTPPKNLHAIFKDSLNNVEAIFEQFEATEKAIYLPRREGRTYAYIPLGEPVGVQLIRKLLDLPPKLVVDIDRKLGLMISIPIGNDLLDSLNEDATEEEALKYILKDGLGLIQSVKEIKKDGEIIVEMKGSTINLELPRYGFVLGTLQTSIAGSVLANIYDSPTILNEESMTGKAITARFRVIKDE